MASIHRILSIHILIASSQPHTCLDIERRGGFRVANWDPPPPACRGAERVKSRPEFFIFQIDIIQRQAPHIPPSLPRLPHTPSPLGLQNAVLEPPRASSAALDGSIEPPKCRPGASEGLLGRLRRLQSRPPTSSCHFRRHFTAPEAVFDAF